MDVCVLLMVGMWYKHEECDEAVGGQCSTSVQWNSQHSTPVQP